MDYFRVESLGSFSLGHKTGKLKADKGEVDE